MGRDDRRRFDGGSSRVGSCKSATARGRLLPLCPCDVGGSCNRLTTAVMKGRTALPFDGALRSAEVSAAIRRARVRSALDGHVGARVAGGLWCRGVDCLCGVSKVQLLMYRGAHLSPLAPKLAPFSGRLTVLEFGPYRLKEGVRGIKSGPGSGDREDKGVRGWVECASLGVRALPTNEPGPTAGFAALYGDRWLGLSACETLPPLPMTQLACGRDGWHHAQRAIVR